MGNLSYGSCFLHEHKIIIDNKPKKFQLKLNQSILHQFVSTNKLHFIYTHKFLINNITLLKAVFFHEEKRKGHNNKDQSVSERN